jgi:hypothetical protein
VKVRTFPPEIGLPCPFCHDLAAFEIGVSLYRCWACEVVGPLDELRDRRRALARARLRVIQGGTAA